MKRIVKDPLFLFLVAGAAIFLAHRLLGDTDDPRRINVDMDSLATFVQHRSQLPDAESARARLAGMTNEGRRFVIDSYVREEALYRESLALGFDQYDYLTKRRLVQKVEFMAEGAASALPPLAEAELRVYYANHPDRYVRPATLTFTHVFFDPSTRGTEAAAAAAQQTLADLKAQAAGFNDATDRGDPFLYHRSYVERSHRELAGHLGNLMADALFDLPMGTWQGPLSSPYGLHLVLVAASAPASLIPFEEARARVRTDAEQARRRAVAEARLNEIVGAYRVEIDSLPGDKALGGLAKKKQTEPSRQSSASTVNPDS